MRDIITIGASAGGQDPLCTLVAGLPANLRAAVFVVVHMGAHVVSHLAAILGRRTGLPTHEARDGMPIERGHIYVAPPAFDLKLAPHHMTLTQGPRKYQNRPSADALFASAAAEHGDRVIGVILSGMLSDGSDGFETILRAGGTTVVQLPWEARFPSMPASALDRGLADHCASMHDMGDLLASLTALERGAPAPLPC